MTETPVETAPLRVGDIVRPKPEWRNTTRKQCEIIPAGRVVRIERGYIIIDGDPRAFVSEVFEVCR